MQQPGEAWRSRTLQSVLASTSHESAVPDSGRILRVSHDASEQVTHQSCHLLRKRPIGRDSMSRRFGRLCSKMKRAPMSLRFPRDIPLRLAFVRLLVACSQKERRCKDFYGRPAIYPSIQRPPFSCTLSDQCYSLDCPTTFDQRPTSWLLSFFFPILAFH